MGKKKTELGEEKHPRDAVTGRWVTWWYALRHPRTTVIETFRRGGRR